MSIRPKQYTPGETAASWAFETIRNDLLNGCYEGGEKIAISSLKDRYNIGLSPLREALNRLSAYGLLVQENQRGFRVPALHIKELNDIKYMRTKLECMALKLAIENGNAEWESSLLAASHRLKRAPHTENNVDEWERYHSDFHNTLVLPCDSKWLLRFIKQLHDQFDRYRRMASKDDSIRKTLDQQHLELVDLAINRKSKPACDLLEYHIELSYQVAARSCEDI